MSLQAQARTQFAAIKTRVPTSVVTVASATQSCQGVRNTTEANTDPGVYGEQGNTSGQVYVDVSEFTTPDRGSTILVAGENVFVIQTRLDPAGAILRISYQAQKPVEGI